MDEPTLKEQIAAEVERLTPQQQAQLLAFARRISELPPIIGTPGEVLLENRHLFKFEPGEVDVMMRAIEEDCERIDWDEWE